MRRIKRGDPPIKPKTSYRKRRDLMLKNFSNQKVLLLLAESATRCGLIPTQSRRTYNRAKDRLLIGLRQNLFTYLRLKALIGIIRKTLFLG